MPLAPGRNMCYAGGMSQKPPTIDYEGLVEQALRRVVRDSLGLVVSTGLPGSSHFYISFNTKQEGVKMADYLRAAHGDKMTIVVQHQFWDLTVRDNDFDITLSFNHRPEVLTIPFAAITEFSDPAAGFALQFTPLVANKNSSEAAVKTLDTAKGKSAAKTLSKAPHKTAKSSKGKAAIETLKPAKQVAMPMKPIALPKGGKANRPASAAVHGNGADVVKLDNFRKKP